MNSQQELLGAIQTISADKNKSYDTPATVLRVEDDTVWVHIDGGADETPVQKTINAEEGETVQVRISNGSAFLVGNASSPPTDDTTANAAHFVAEQADEKATEAVRSVNAISQTVQGKVSSGDSNIQSLSSTMYQNENGVNIFNNELEEGDSYAHIDGDSFDIKEATTEGEIDDENDLTIASFGKTEVSIGYVDEEEGGYKAQITPDSIKLIRELRDPYSYSGWTINDQMISYGGHGALGFPTAVFGAWGLRFQSPTSGVQDKTEIGEGDALFESQNYGTDEHKKITIDDGEIKTEDLSHPYQIETDINPGIVHIYYAGGYYENPDSFIISTDLEYSGTPTDVFCVDQHGNVRIAGEVKDMSGNNKYSGGGGTSAIVVGDNLVFTSGAYVNGDNLIII